MNIMAGEDFQGKPLDSTSTMESVNNVDDCLKKNLLKLQQINSNYRLDLPAGSTTAENVVKIFLCGEKPLGSLPDFDLSDPYRDVARCRKSCVTDGITRYRRYSWYRNVFYKRQANFKLCRAVSHNNLIGVEELLRLGSSPNCYDPLHRTPLHLATSHGFTEMVKLLLAWKADPNLKDSIGNTPMHLAVCTNNVPVIKLLLQAGTDLDNNHHAGQSMIQLATTKLNIIQRVGKPNPELVAQITQVIQLIKDHMTRKETVDPDLLSQLFSVMTVNESEEVHDLLNKLKISNK